MKIRKILPLLAIVLIAVFVLAGCDSILETLFPNDTGHGGGSTPANNTISVTAFLWTDRYYATSAYFGKVHIDLMDSTGNTVVQSSAQWVNSYDNYFYDSGYPYYTYLWYYRYPIDASFNFVEDGTYTLRVYYDLNYSNSYDVSTEYVVSNQYNYWSSYPLYIGASGNYNIVVSSGQSVSAKAYIDYDGFEYFAALGY